MHNEASWFFEFLVPPHTLACAERFNGGGHFERMIPRFVEIHVFLGIPGPLCDVFLGLAGLTPEVLRELLVPIAVVGLVEQPSAGRRIDFMETLDHGCVSN